jgi:hypothetical protein
MANRTLRLTALEVLERLHLTRTVLGAIHGCSVRSEPFSEPWRSGTDVLNAIARLEQYAAERLERRDIAAYAADVGAYARLVLGELLAAAPASTDLRPKGGL